VTDFNPAIEQRPNRPGVTHRACDAERVDALFAPRTFDLVFSSNMLEHLPDARAAVAAMGRVLADDGVAIHVVPSPFWKFCHLTGFYPNAVLSRVERWTERGKAPRSSAAPDAWDNNPKTAGRRYGYVRRLLWPVPHGISQGNFAEFAAFAPARWRSLFESAGYRVAAQIAGPVSSGYGFGLDGPRRLLERLGFASEYAYVMIKAGSTSPHLAAFTAAQV
jgi:SAM-dependent methyltransferase